VTNEKALAIADDNHEQIVPVAPKRRSILTVSEEQLSRIKTLSTMMAESQLDYRKMGAGDIFIKMLKGLEIGLEPIAAMDLIDVIQGKPTLKPQGMLSLVYGSGQLSDISITDDGNCCTVKMKRSTMSVHIETFSAADAAAMGLANKPNWTKQPSVMRKWRAISAACRVVFPDIIQGMYIPEELSPDTAVNTDGEIEDAEFTEVEPQQKQDTPPPATDTIWPSRDTVAWVMDAFRNQEIGDSDILRLAGVKSFDDGDGWRKYATPKAAINAIQEAINAEIDGNQQELSATFTPMSYVGKKGTLQLATFTHMSYVGKKGTLQFLTHEPGTKSNTCALLFEGRGGITTMHGNEELYEQLNLAQYDDIKNKNIVSDFVKMTIPVDFYFESVTPKNSGDEPYNRITGIKGDPVIPF
jgi:hypothetical protein